MIQFVPLKFSMSVSVDLESQNISDNDNIVTDSVENVCFILQIRAVNGDSYRKIYFTVGVEDFGIKF